VDPNLPDRTVNAKNPKSFQKKRYAKIDGNTNANLTDRRVTAFGRKEQRAGIKPKRIVEAPNAVTLGQTDIAANGGRG
jgi:hypothetical protein